MTYPRNVGSLSKNTIAGLLWDIVADSAQFMYTFTSADDFNATPQLNMPVSNLSVRRILLSANLHVTSIDTPRHCLTKIPTGGVNKNSLSRTQQQQVDYDRHYRRGGGGSSGTGGSGHSNGGDDDGSCNRGRGDT